MAIGVVSATTSSTPKLEWKKKKKVLRKELAKLYQNFQVSFVDNVESLYRLPWILAVVDG